MTRNEWEEIVRAFSNDVVGSDVDGLLRALLNGPAAAEGGNSADTRRRLHTGADSLVLFPSAVQPAESQTVAANTTADGDSVASMVLRTIGMATGVGPVITGLLRLFGGNGGAQEPDYTPLPYSLPEQIKVDAGLAADRSFVDLGYSAQGGPRVAPSARASQPAIHINVRAMDSQSFTDRSDDIARAVREALLRSHSLNDIIAEI